ncbi:MAG: hypothetical protein ABIJ31_14560 [Pseudomonadota bacterium]
MELTHIFSWTFAYDFIQGPMVWIAFIVFFLGTVFQVFRFFSLMKKKPIQTLKAGPGRFITRIPSGKEKTDWVMALKLSIVGVNPFMTILSTIFHVLLVILPLFVLGHNILLDNAFGISLVSLPESVSDSLTLVVVACALVFLYRRLFLYRVKIITTFGDFLFLILAAAPFVTGYLAYHQVGVDYKIMVSLHILFGELMLMAVPFTKFVHMIYLLIVRFTVVSEYGLGKGNRTW